jgi:hypothetical protein
MNVAARLFRAAQQGTAWCLAARAVLSFRVVPSTASSDSGSSITSPHLMICGLSHSAVTFLSHSASRYLSHNGGIFLSHSRSGVPGTAVGAVCRGAQAWAHHPEVVHRLAHGLQPRLMNDLMVALYGGGVTTPRAKAVRKRHEPE